MKAKLLKYISYTDSAHIQRVECPKFGQIVKPKKCEACEHLRMFDCGGVRCLYGLAGRRFKNNKECNAVDYDYEFNNINAIIE